MPDPKLTPGAVLTTDAAAICQPGYSRSVRHTPGSLKHRIYAEYGIDQKTGRYEIDHLIPLGIGGAEAPSQTESSIPSKENERLG